MLGETACENVRLSPRKAPSTQHKHFISSSLYDMELNFSVMGSIDSLADECRFFELRMCAHGDESKVLKFFGRAMRTLQLTYSTPGGGLGGFQSFLWRCMEVRWDYLAWVSVAFVCDDCIFLLDLEAPWWIDSSA